MSKKKKKCEWRAERLYTFRKDDKGISALLKLKMFFIKYHPNKRLKFGAWIQVKVIISPIKQNDIKNNRKYSKAC